MADEAPFRKGQTVRLPMVKGEEGVWTARVVECARGYAKHWYATGLPVRTKARRLRSVRIS